MLQRLLPKVFFDTIHNDLYSKSGSEGSPNLISTILPLPHEVLYLLTGSLHHCCSVCMLFLLKCFLGGLNLMFWLIKFSNYHKCFEINYNHYITCTICTLKIFKIKLVRWDFNLHNNFANLWKINLSGSSSLTVASILTLPVWIFVLMQDKV